jgi:Ca2+-binding EF-hand superfamily protein
MAAKHFNEVYDSSPSVKQSLREFCLRRDFQKAIVAKFGNDFGTSEDELRKVFDSVDTDSNGEIDKDEVKGLIKRIYPFLNDDDPLFTEVMHSLDIDSSDSVKWDEFKKVFLSKKI